MDIWYSSWNFSRFSILYQEKSGNPAQPTIMTHYSLYTYYVQRIQTWQDAVFIVTVM
jgi:hypothetical protein